MTQGASERGATSTAAGGSPCGTTQRRSLCPPRSGQVAPQPRARPAISAGRRERRGAPSRLPDLPSQPATAALLTRPEPSEGDPRQLRAALAAAPPAELAAGAERRLPAPSSGGGGAGAAREGAAPGPCWGGARRGTLPQVSEGLPRARGGFPPVAASPAAVGLAEGARGVFSGWSPPDRHL